MVACSLAAVWQCRRLKLRPLPSPPFPAHPLLPLPLLLLLAALALPPRKVPQQAAWMVAKITCMGQVGTGFGGVVRGAVHPFHGADTRGMEWRDYLKSLG